MSQGVNCPLILFRAGKFMAISDFWFHHDLRVRYSQVDAQTIVFFGNYMSYFDNAHREYMRALEFNYQKYVKEHNADFHIVKVDVEYHAPARFDDELEIYVRTERIGRSSMTVRFETYKKGSDQILTSAHSTMVNADQATMKSTPWPDNLVQRIISKEPLPLKRSKLSGLILRQANTDFLFIQLTQISQWNLIPE